MGRVLRKKVKGVVSVVTNSTGPITRSKRNKHLSAHFNELIKQNVSKTQIRSKKKRNKKKNSVNKVIKNNKLESVGTASKVTSNITSDNIVNITNRTIDGNGSMNFYTVPSKIKGPNIKCDDIIDITDTIIGKNEYQNFPVSSTLRVKNIEYDDVINITDTSICKDENKNVPISSTVTVKNIEYDDIIDITDTTICKNENKNVPMSSSVTVTNIEFDDIIDITDEIIKENKFRTSNETVLYDNSSQFTSNVTHVQNQPIEVVTISDSEEESSCQQSEKEPTHFKSIGECLKISDSATRTIKKSYNSPLHYRKNMLKDKNVQFSSFSSGAFIIDKQTISNSQNLKCEAPTFSQQHKATKNATSNSKGKLRPIIIDGLNIGHA